MLLEGCDIASELAISRRLFDLKELVRPYYLKWLYFHLKKENCPTTSGIAGDSLPRPLVTPRR